MNFPTIIQGGMGFGVSGYRLARAVAGAGQLGVVSGTALDLLLSRRLQLGDADGDLRLAAATFPDQSLANRVLDRYFRAQGQAADEPFLPRSMIDEDPSRRTLELLVLAAYVEVYLAKLGHEGQVGINLLQKIQPPTLPTLYGAMLAGVDVVIVGAGIPMAIPAVLRAMAAHRPAELTLELANDAGGTGHRLIFRPSDVVDVAELPALKRPAFFPVVSSTLLATMLMRKADGPVDGLVIEGPTAGGHNAPPRGKMTLNTAGEPIYGRRDEVDLAAIADMGKPFWLAGGYGRPEALREAWATSATGVQVGTLFAFCEESGLSDELKTRAIRALLDGSLRVRTDPLASPTGYPFKILELPQTLADRSLYEQRPRMCDLGYLREAYTAEDGSVHWRCKADDPAKYEHLGGSIEQASGRVCLCNALAANVGLGQKRPDGSVELPLLTCGDHLDDLRAVLRPGEERYTAQDVLTYLLS